MDDAISQKQAERAIAILKKMPGKHLTNIVDRIEDVLSRCSAEDIGILCRYFACNDKMLSHRILGWKEFRTQG